MSDLRSQVGKLIYETYGIIAPGLLDDIQALLINDCEYCLGHGKTEVNTTCSKCNGTGTIRTPLQSEDVDFLIEELYLIYADAGKVLTTKSGHKIEREKF